MTADSRSKLVLVFGFFIFFAMACEGDAGKSDSDGPDPVPCNGVLCSSAATCLTEIEVEQCVCDTGFLGDGETCDAASDWVRHQIGEQDNAIYVTTGDMDGDGQSDMIVTSSDHSPSYQSEIAWYKNPGGGNNWAKHIISAAAAKEPVWATNGVAVGDVNGDGKMGVVVGTGPAPRSATDIGGVYLFTRGADSSPEWKRTIIFENEGESFFKVYFVDFNDDGLDDIVAGGSDAGLIALNPGNTQDEWKIDRLSDGTGGGLYLGDIDNDNTPEIISANAYAKKITATYVTLEGDKLSFVDVEIAELDWVLDVYTFDVNGDDFKDVIASRIAGPGLRWFENPGNGRGSWTEHLIDKDLSCTDIYSGDLNGDGVEDVVVSGLAIMVPEPPPMSIVWFEIQGEADSVEWKKHYIDYDKPDLNAPGDVELVDMNGDGKLDIATTSMTDHLVLWYENSVY